MAFELLTPIEKVGQIADQFLKVLLVERDRNDDDQGRALAYITYRHGKTELIQDQSC